MADFDKEMTKMEIKYQFTRTYRIHYGIFSILKVSDWYQFSILSLDFQFVSERVNDWPFYALWIVKLSIKGPILRSKIILYTSLHIYAHVYTTNNQNNSTIIWWMTIYSESSRWATQETKCRNYEVNVT